LVARAVVAAVVRRVGQKGGALGRTWALEFGLSSPSRLPVKFIPKYTAHMSRLQNFIFFPTSHLPISFELIQKNHHITERSLKTTKKNSKL
jgi:hypothetical protein